MGGRPEGFEHMAGSDFEALDRMAAASGTTADRLACALVEQSLDHIRQFGVTPGGAGLLGPVQAARRKG